MFFLSPKVLSIVGFALRFVKIEFRRPSRIRFAIPRALAANFPVSAQDMRLPCRNEHRTRLIQIPPNVTAFLIPDERVWNLTTDL
jgi:hypothetical protein